MIIFNQETREFIAKYIGDMSKAIFTVAFASYFFEKFALPLRVGFVILAFVFFFIGIYIISKKGE